MFAQKVLKRDNTLLGTMSWVYEAICGWVQQWCIRIIRCGLVPKHIAIIMDGNRRFARRNCVQRYEGHIKGFDTLAETLQWCLEIGVCELTVYAFSIENFKRSKDEVETLMELAKEKFKMMIDEWRKLKEHGVCVRLIGNLSLIPKDLLALILVAMLLTQDNDKSYLNIAFSYTSREEMCNFSREIISSMKDNELENEDITTGLLDKCCYTHTSTDPELIIRTSGEVRVSDFLTWQSASNFFHFVKVLWPEFSPWDLITAVFFYQHFYTKIKNLQRKNCSTFVTDGGAEYSRNLQKKRIRQLLSCLDFEALDDIDVMENFTSEQVFDYYKNYIAPKI